MKVINLTLTLDYTSKDPKYLKLNEPQNAGLSLALERKIEKHLGPLAEELEEKGFPADPNPRVVSRPSDISIFATFLPSIPFDENKYLEAFRNACQQALAELDIKDELLPYVKISNRNPIFDITKGFELIEVEPGRFAYVNHAEKLLLPSFGSKEAAERNKDSYLALRDSIEKAKQRYKQTFDAVTSSYFKHYSSRSGKSSLKN